MKAVKLIEGQARVVEIPEPARRAGEALLQLRVGAATPYELAQLTGASPAPGILGRQFLATVLEAEDPDLAGRRVLGTGWLACGSCRYCNEGRPRFCRVPVVPGSPAMPGCFCERFCYPTQCLVTVPDRIRDYDAIMAETLATGMALTDLAKAADRVLVIGDPATALGAAVGLSLAHESVYVECEQQPHMQLLKGYGIRRDPGGVFSTIVMLGASSEAVDRTLSRVEPQGLLVLGKAPFPLVADLAPSVARDITIRCAPPGSPADAFEALRTKEVCEMLSKIRQETYVLAQGEAALAAAMRPDALMILLDNLGPRRKK